MSEGDEWERAWHFGEQSQNCLESLQCVLGKDMDCGKCQKTVRQAGWGQVKAFVCHVVMAGFYCDESYQTIGTDHAKDNGIYKPNLGHNVEEISR